MKKYNIIYADPPWRYKVYSKKGLGRSAESHYPTMELEDIRALPVGTLAADDCVLFLWTTIPLLHDCFSVMRAWGFSYKTVAFVWIKQNRKSDSLFWGMGHWTRANAEFCMLATKGHPKRRSAGVHQVILSHIEEHSKKPEEARRRIVELMGDLPRIEHQGRTFLLYKDLSETRPSKCHRAKKSRRVRNGLDCISALPARHRRACENRLHNDASIRVASIGRSKSFS